MAYYDDIYEPHPPPHGPLLPGRAPRGNNTLLTNERRRGEEDRIDEIKRRRAAAFLATHQVAEYYAAQSQPQRGKYKKPAERPGKYRTLREMRDYLRQKYGNWEKKIPPRQNTLPTRDTGVYGGRSSGISNESARSLGRLVFGSRDLTGFQPFFEELAAQQGTQLAESQLRSQRLRRLSTAGPRRALATRPLQPSAAGLTNRTGANATRGSAASGASATAASGSARASEVLKAQGYVAGAKGYAPASSTTSASASRNQVVTQNALPRLLANAQGSLDSQLDQFLKQTRTQTATRARAGVRAPARAGLRVSAPPALTAGSSVASLNPTTVASLVGTQTMSGKCDCPKPKKEKKKEFQCSNPIVSRYVKDGLIIIKRKLVCPSSSQRSVLPPTQPTTTSSPGQPSSIPGAARSSRSASPLPPQARNALFNRGPT